MLRCLAYVLGAGLLFALLTAITQLGGLAFLVALLLLQLLRRAGIGKFMAASGGVVFFVAAIIAVNRYAVPPLAALNGREPLPCDANAERSYTALSTVYCLLGRNYVRPEVKAMLEAMARDLNTQYPGLTVAYLDAGFPFLDGFPLPPHLSHHDGRRIDLAYFYTDEAGNFAPLTAPSPIGYWGFETPPSGEAPACEDKVRWLTFRWDMGWFQAFMRKDLMLDQERTAALLRWLSVEGPRHGVDKILLEPHMVKRLQVSSPMIRFQGCRAARHDDHIHVEVGKGQP